MKRLVPAVVAFCLIAGFAPLFAQEAEPADPFAIKFIHESPYYPLHANVIRVDQSAYGYRVIYRKGNAGVAEAFIPNDWFVPGGKAQLIAGDHPSYPHLVVYLKEGKFSHVRLYVRDNIRDPSWGYQASSPELESKFKVDEVKLEY